MKSEEISAFLHKRIEARDFPSAVYLVAEKGEIVFRDALGLAVVEPEKIEARIDTIYDLASLTKPLVTGLLCAKLIEQRKVNLSDKIAEYFSDFKTDDKREITIENLLTHASGLAAWKPFYSIANSRLEILNAIADAPLETPPNEKVIYSDLNFILLGFLLEKIYGKSLAQIAESEIFAPLGLQNTFYNPPKSMRKRIAASEKGNFFEKQIAGQFGFEVEESKIRKRLVWGEVHDGNCRFMNGVSGHAGLFSNASETFKIALQFLPDSTKLLKPEICSLFCANFTENLNEARSIAFELAETKDSTAGEGLSKDSFGHLGFTGTSLWIDPQKERIYILLTNRTHARRLPFADTKPARRKFHELAAEILDNNKSA